MAKPFMTGSNVVLQEHAIALSNAVSFCVNVTYKTMPPGVLTLRNVAQIFKTVELITLAPPRWQNVLLEGNLSAASINIFTVDILAESLYIRDVEYCSRSGKYLV